MDVLISVIVGLLPEIVFYNALMFEMKNIRASRIKFILVNLVYTIALMCFVKYDVIFHVLYVAGTVLQYRLFYHESIDIIDIFALTNVMCIAMLFSFVCYPICSDGDVGKYYLAFGINRILLLAGYIRLKDKIRVYYIRHRELWNRHDGAKIKSLTVRNIGLCICNLLIFFSFLALQMILNWGVR